MEEILFVTKERKVELDKMFEKGILEFETNVINKNEFIIIIKSKRISFSDFCYLVNTYVTPLEAFEKQDDLLNRIRLSNIDDIYLNTESEYDTSYSRTIKTTIPKIQNTKKIKKYENMLSKNKKMIKKKSGRERIS